MDILFDSGNLNNIEKGFLHKGRDIPMVYDVKSTEDLLKEVEELRRRVAELEALEDRRQKAESLLRESEEKSRAILENIEDGYYEVDLTGKYLFCNEAYAKIHGLPKEELIEKSYKGS